MPDALSTINTRTTPQNVQAAPEQTKNLAGGYTFEVDTMTRLRRFLACGVEGGTYYADQKTLVDDATGLVLACVRERGMETLRTVVDMSVSGATVKQQPLMLVMAALAGEGEPEVRKATLDVLPEVARTSTMLFTFLGYVQNFRGWGRGMRRAVGKWYLDNDLDNLAYQFEKYRNREGWSHGDALRKSHPITSDPARDMLFRRALGRNLPEDTLPATTMQAIALANADSEADVLAVIRNAERVSWEMVPTQHLGSAEVWQALLDGGHVPITATLKNLARLTANGTLDPIGVDDRTSRVIARLRDPDVLRKGRVHPMSVLLAAATYASGRSLRGDSTWHPIPNVNKALDAGFMAAFASIEPITDKTAMLGVDTSQSMDGGSVAGLPLVPRTAACALGMALAAHFPRNMGVGFTAANADGALMSHGTTDGTYRDSGIRPLDLDPTRRLVDLIAESSTFPMGRTDCSLPILYAMEKGLAIDAFVILTDNETWAGKMHPHQALRQYRERTGINARMVTVAMVNNPSTIADPKDPLMLDVVGLDSRAVGLVVDFIAGRV